MVAADASSREKTTRRERADGGARAPTLFAAGYAWEFLRRNPAYRQDYSRSLAACSAGEIDSRWGLRFAADPAEPAPDAPVFWRADVAPAVVVCLQPQSDVTAPALPLPAPIDPPRHAEDGLHLRLCDGLQAWVRGARAASGPLVVHLAFDADLGIRLRAADALRAVANARRPRATLAPAQRRRLNRILVALDGSLENVSYRQIAARLFDHAEIERPDWKTCPARDTTIRLVRAGRALMQGAYLRLLRRID